MAIQSLLSALMYMAGFSDPRTNSPGRKGMVLDILFFKM